MLSFIELTRFIESQITVLQKPLKYDKKLRKLIKTQGNLNINDYNSDYENDPELEDIIRRRKTRPITDEQMEKLVTMVNIWLHKRMEMYFNKQTIHAITMDIMRSESSSNLAKIEKLMTLNNILICYPLPDMNGDIKSHAVTLDEDGYEEEDEEGEFGGDNVNLHGLLNIKKEDILKLIDELPSSSKILSRQPNTDGQLGYEDEQARSEELRKYEDERVKLQNNRQKLIVLQEKLNYYKDLRSKLAGQVDKLKIFTNEDDKLDLRNHLIDLSDKLENVQGKLQDKRKLKDLQERIKLNFESAQ